MWLNQFLLPIVMKPNLLCRNRGWDRTRPSQCLETDRTWFQPSTSVTWPGDSPPQQLVHMFDAAERVCVCDDGVCSACQSSAERDPAPASAILPAGRGLVQQQNGGNREGEQRLSRNQQLISLNESKLDHWFPPPGRLLGSGTQRDPPETLWGCPPRPGDECRMFFHL